MNLLKSLTRRRLKRIPKSIEDLWKSLPPEEKTAISSDKFVEWLSEILPGYPILRAWYPKDTRSFSSEHIQQIKNDREVLVCFDLIMSSTRAVEVVYEIIKMCSDLKLRVTKVESPQSDFMWHGIPCNNYRMNKAILYLENE